MQLGQGKPPVGIVFDTGISQPDQALAMSLLYGLDGKNEIRMVSISVSRGGLKAAAYCDAVGRFYAGAVNSGFGALARTLPVGLSTLGQPQDTPMLEHVPAYPNGIEKMNDTAEPDALIRNALTAQFDQNAIVVLAGPATNLAQVLSVHGAREWIERKVKFLAVAAGAYPDGDPEPNVRADIRAAQKLFAEWPGPIVAAGAELGAALPFPGASIDKDFAWSDAHPVADAYRAYRPMPYDAPAAALAVALYAGRPHETYFKLSDPGIISVTPEGRTKLTPSANGRHRYLIVDPAARDRVIAAYVELASAKPVPRAPRVRRKDAAEKKN